MNGVTPERHDGAYFCNDPASRAGQHNPDQAGPCFFCGEPSVVCLRTREHNVASAETGFWRSLENRTPVCEKHEREWRMFLALSTLVVGDAS